MVKVLKSYQATTGKHLETPPLPWTGASGEGVMTCIGKYKQPYCVERVRTVSPGNLSGVPYIDIQNAYTEELKRVGASSIPVSNSTESIDIVTETGVTYKVRGVSYSYNVRGIGIYKGVFTYYAQHGKKCSDGDLEATVKFGYPVTTPQAVNLRTVNDAIFCRHKIAYEL